MGTQQSDIDGLYACINHLERMVRRQVCATVERDGLPIEYCTCCDECRATCLATPHGHGRSPEEEWQGNFCKICGEDISRWIK